MNPTATADHTHAEAAAIAGSSALAAILLVEDEALVREVTAEVLQSAGYWVLKAGNAVEARSLFRGFQRQVQLLITDLVMPGQDGRLLAHELSAIRPGLKTLLTSGYPEARHGTPEPGWHYLPKPFSVDSLLGKVREMLS